MLLTNVCRLGGATEYETCITGSENGYNSIKSIVGETTRYEFADGDAIGVPADVASNARLRSVQLLLMVLIKKLKSTAQVI